MLVLVAGFAMVALHASAADPPDDSAAGASHQPANRARPVQQVEQPAILTVSGQGQVSVAPEIATVRLGVEREADSAAAAQSAINATMNKVIAALKNTGLDEKNIQTAQLNLNPIHERPKPGQETPSKILGYRGSNTVEVKLHELDRIGDTIDAAFKAGANRLDGVSFGLEHPAREREQALELAARNAVAKAHALAATLDVRLVAIQKIYTAGISHPAQPMVAGGIAGAMMAATPVEPGQVDVNASVTIEFAIENGHHPR